MSMLFSLPPASDTYKYAGLELPLKPQYPPTDTDIYHSSKFRKLMVQETIKGEDSRPSN